MQPSGLKSLKPAVKCDNKKQPGKVIFPKCSHNSFSFLCQERLLPEALFFTMKDVSTTVSKRHTRSCWGIEIPSWIRKSAKLETGTVSECSLRDSEGANGRTCQIGSTGLLN